MGNARAILITAALTVLPVAAYSQAKTSTRRRLSLYYLASRWCDAQRCVLVSVWSPQHGRHPGGQQRS